ncbi:MAG: helix-turn-helix domain-containing protein [Gammaproteobacteria bacterium]|nr:helix-turn-helix domain-containing protein [Gammaproteobacteria bacterium]
MKSLQVIKSLNGRDEYVLLPMPIYRSLHNEIDRKILELTSIKNKKEDYIPFMLEDYVDNPVAIARIKAGITQEELAEKLGVSQAYISKLEGQEKVSPKTLQKILSSLDEY